MIFIDEQPVKTAGATPDLTAWLGGVTSSLPRVIVVNVDSLGIADKQIRRESGRRVLSRLIAREFSGQANTLAASEKLEVIGSILDPSIQVYAPHHMARRIFGQTDSTLKLMREGQFIDFQRVAGVWVYHWDMLRAVCLSEKSSPKFRACN